MKALLFFAMTGLLAAQTSSIELSAEEKKAGLAELARTKAMVETSLAGLSEAQGKWKAAPEKWSVLECVEHLAMTEQALAGMLAGSLKGPEASAEQMAKSKGKSQVLARFMPDRGSKAQAPAEVRPTGKFTTLAVAKAALLAARSQTVAMLEKGDASLKTHVLKHPFFGEIDGLTWFQMMSLHMERHNKQIEEVKANLEFPR
jgi:hypothetical protein